MFGLEYEFEWVNLRWFELICKWRWDDWIKGKIVWFKWMWVKNLWKFVYDVIDKI